MGLRALGVSDSWFCWSCGSRQEVESLRSVLKSPGRLLLLEMF